MKSKSNVGKIIKLYSKPGVVIITSFLSRNFCAAVFHRMGTDEVFARKIAATLVIACTAINILLSYLIIIASEFILLKIT